MTGLTLMFVIPYGYYGVFLKKCFLADIGNGALQWQLLLLLLLSLFSYLFRTKQCNNQAQTIMQCKLKK